MPRNPLLLFPWLVALALATSIAAGDGTRGPAPAGVNPLITFPLHAHADGDKCSVAPIDCLPKRPTVNVAPNTTTTIYLTAYNYTALAGIQTAFEWDPDWQLDVPGSGFFRLGMICVAQGGIDACNPPDPVQPKTWGQVKATYR